MIISNLLYEIFRRELEIILLRRRKNPKEPLMSFYYPERDYPTYDPDPSPRYGIVYGKNNLLVKNHYGTRNFLNREEPYKWRINVYCENEEDAKRFCNILFDFMREKPQVGFQFKPWGGPESFCLYFEDNKSLVEFLDYLSEKNFKTIKPSKKPAFFVELNVNENPLYLFRTIYRIIPKNHWNFSSAVSEQIETIINKNLVEKYSDLFGKDLQEIIMHLSKRGLRLGRCIRNQTAYVLSISRYHRL